MSHHGMVRLGGGVVLTSQQEGPTSGAHCSQAAAAAGGGGHTTCRRAGRHRKLLGTKPAMLMDIKAVAGLLILCSHRDRDLHASKVRGLRCVGVRPTVHPPHPPSAGRESSSVPSDATMVPWSGSSTCEVDCSGPAPSARRGRSCRQVAKQLVNNGSPKAHARSSCVQREYKSLKVLSFGCTGLLSSRPDGLRLDKGCLRALPARAGVTRRSQHRTRHCHCPALSEEQLPLHQTLREPWQPVCTQQSKAFPTNQ